MKDFAAIITEGNARNRALAIQAAAEWDGANTEDLLELIRTRFGETEQQFYAGMFRHLPDAPNGPRVELRTPLVVSEDGYVIDAGGVCVATTSSDAAPIDEIVRRCNHFDRLTAAAKTVLAGLDARLLRADGHNVPAFEEMGELSLAVAVADPRV